MSRPTEPENRSGPRYLATLEVKAEWDEPSGAHDIADSVRIVGTGAAATIIFSSHHSLRQPVVEGDEVTIATVMSMTLSLDHRVIDGATGAKFLQTFKKILENPLYLVV